MLVVDHESDVAAAASLTQRFPWIKLIERSTNEGFATGINLGARLGRAPFLLLLNPDCVVTPSACDRLLRFLVPRVDVAIAGPRILNADGSVQGSARRFPGVTTVIAGRSSWLTRRFPRNPLSRLNLPGLDAGEQPLDVDWVSGACMLVRRSAFEQAGGMDECFFLYLGRRRFLSATVAARMAHDVPSRCDGRACRRKEQHSRVPGVTGGVSRQRVPPVPEARALAASSPDASCVRDASASATSASVDASPAGEWK